MHDEVRYDGFYVSAALAGWLVGRGALRNCTMSLEMF